MSKGMKIFLFASLLVFAAGFVISLVSLAFSYRRVLDGSIIDDIRNTSGITIKDYMCSSEITVIRVDVLSSDVRVQYADRPTVGISYGQRTENQFEITEQDGRLTVKEKRQLRLLWFSWDIWGDESVVIFLPDELRLTDVSLSSASGSVTADGLKAETLTAKSASGNVNLNDVQAESITASGTSGNMNITGGQANQISAKSVSGDAKIQAVADIKNIKAESTSGNVKVLEIADCAEFDLRSVSGNVNVTVPSQDIGSYTYSASTVSGNVKIGGNQFGASAYQSGNRTGYNMTLRSTSGNIRVSGIGQE